jgi:YidC/Oxa1 family membrane protein insertase
MGFFGDIFYLIFYQPLYNGFVFLINISPFHDIGIAVILLTLVVRLILFPLSHRSIITQRKIKEIEPEVKKIKEKFKNNRQEQAKETMALYKAHGISLFSGFLMLLIQLPILFALFKLFSGGLSFSSGDLYSFVKLPSDIRMNFLGLFDISKSSLFWAIMTGITQFLQMRFSLPKIPKSDGPQKGSFQEALSRSMNVQFRYIMPAFIFFIALRFPSGLALYWTSMNVFAIVHEVIVAYKAKKIMKNNGTENRNYQKNH